MRPPRRLSAAEHALWREVTRTVMPLDGVIPSAGGEESGAAPPVAATAPKPETPRRASAPSYSPPPQSNARPGVAGLERKFRKRVEGGRIGIEAAIDLHGLNQEQAHGALLDFLLRAQRDDRRLVLVVTGKGRFERPGIDGFAQAGVLRRAVPHWLRDPVLRTVVLGFEEAGRGHGGAGALYVRLRRPA